MHETKSQRIWAVWAVLAAIALAAAPFQTANAQCNYEVEAIIASEPCDPYGQLDTYPRGMNSRGDVVGSFLNCGFGGEAFFWSKDTGFVALPRPPGVISARADDVNDDRIVCGLHWINGVGFRGFVYDMNNPDAGFTYLEPLHGVGQYGSANAINDSNIVAGSRHIGKPDQSPNPYNAVLWNVNPGNVADLGVMHGPNSAAMDGNTSTDAAGWAGTAIATLSTRAILWTNGKGQDIGVLPGHVQSQARRLNSTREIIGSSRESPSGPYNSFWWKDGVMKPFPVPDGYRTAGAADISDVGQLVGGMSPKPGLPNEAFVLQHGEFHNLLSLIVDTPPNLGISFTVRVSNDGRILAEGGIGLGPMGVLLKPIDQPPTDLNHDCRTDVHDLLILLEQWGPVPLSTSGVPIADFNGDGFVDVLDLLILLDHWDR
jgi:hypothetical protein